MDNVEPSGMTHAGRSRLERLVTEFGYKAVGRMHTVFGEVFLAERPSPEGYSVVWASRDMAQEITMEMFSSQGARIRTAMAAAEKQLQIRNGVYREV